MADLYPFKSGPIEPICLPGQIVGIWQKKNYVFGRVVYIEGIPPSDPIEVNLGAIAAGGTSAIVQTVALSLSDDEFGQFRCKVKDDICAMLWQARPDGRYKLRNRNARVTRWTNEQDPCGHTTEFYVYEQDDAFHQALNPTAYNLTQARLVFWGFRYVIDHFDTDRYSYPNNVPAQWTRVPATAHL